MTVFPKAWALTDPVLLAEGGGGSVWRVRGPDGRTVIAKRLSPAALAEADHAAAWRRAQDGQGAVRLLDATDDWQLLEDAGDRTLADLLDDDGDDAAARIAAQVLAALHADDPGDGQGLHPLTERLSSLRQAAVRRGGPFAEAADLSAVLLAEATPPRRLHGDLHHDNILHGPRGWLAIDPHGVFGDPAYDAANLLYNPVERRDLRTDPARARRLADVLAPTVGRPASTILGWAFCHACLSAAWHDEDGDTDEVVHSLEAARAFRQALGGD